MNAKLALVMLTAGLTGCSAGIRRFPDKPVVWVDPDTNNVKEQPATYWSGETWGIVDQIFFKPWTRGLSLQVAPPAVNVNAWDEVPDSSWFENRIGLRPMSSAEIAKGACPDDLLDPQTTWTLTSGKFGGKHAGFVIRDAKARTWLVKFDDLDQPERASAAEVIGSRVYYAAGYNAPCNIVVNFDPSILVLDPKAHKNDELDRKQPMTSADVDSMLGQADRLPDGRVRATASLFVKGKNIGPWTYQGRRKDDPNDVIAHEDRRELRGAKLIAAWLNHWDSREANTLATWVQEDGRSFVKHWMIDFGDSLGMVWWKLNIGLSQRAGYSYYFDFEHVFVDYVTLGAVPRPWNHVTLSKDSPFGFYADEPFDPRRWKGCYPNPAFIRMSPQDGAWMARILARFDDDAVKAMVAEAKFQSAKTAEILTKTLVARRDRILAEYLRIRSPLADFRVSGDTVCFTDLAAQTGQVKAVTYSATQYQAPFRKAAATLAVDATNPAHICSTLRPSPASDPYTIVDLVAHPQGEDPLPPARLHLVAEGTGFRLVGIERPGNP